MSLEISYEEGLAMLDKKRLLENIFELDIIALNISFKNLSDTYNDFKEQPIDSNEVMLGYLKEIADRTEHIQELCEVVKRQTQTLNELFKNS